MADSHTLVIPTYNRPDLLRRLVTFYCGHARTTSLLVLDSSTPEVAQANGSALLQLGESIRHVVFPETVPVTAKLARGLELVQSPFVSLCGDDDLVFPEGLREAVAFLGAHPDYVCAHGLYLNFRLAGHDVHLTSEYAGPGNEAGHPGARVFRLLQRYESLFYGVFRAAELREILSAAQALPTIHYQELFQSVAALIKGKVRRLSRLYGARRTGAPAEPGRDRWQTYYWFADNPVEVVEHYRAYCGEVWRFYEKHSASPRLERDAFYRILDLAHAVYFSAGCPPEYFHSVLQAHWPEDRYLDIGGVNLFDELRPLGAPKQAARRLLGTLGSRWQNASLAYGLGSLNREAREACRTAWKCHLPVRLHWLAGVADFRKHWLELCSYLDPL